MPLKDAAAVNATRWEFYRRLQATGLPLEVGTGGRTKFNRTQRNLPKADWLDAACVGASTPRQLDVVNVRPLVLKATGHGRRQPFQPVTHVVLNSISAFRQETWLRQLCLTASMQVGTLAELLFGFVLLLGWAALMSIQNIYR